MIKILDDTKTLSALATDTTNGLGQIQPLSCVVTEELNGIYEAELTVAESDKHFDDLHVSGLLLITAGELEGEQMFRIYKITKPINGVCTVYCQHISYDLSKIAVLPFTATGATNTCAGLVSHITGGSYPFSMSTDIGSSSTFALTIPRTFRECLGGYDGSVLDVFRGEYEWNNIEVIMHARRGADNGVRIAYGKNLTDFQQEENIESVYTSVLGYVQTDTETIYGEVYHKVQSGYPKVMIVDFTNDYDVDDIPTSADLTAKAQAYANANDIEIPKVNLSISFVPLYQTEEYKNIAPLERVSLGDTVHVFFDRLGVEASARVIKTEWNSELKRYESIELGDAKANMNTLLNEAIGEAKKQSNTNKGFLEDTINEMASLIINGLGLHRTLVPVDGGGYRIYLHNKATLEESDTQYVMSASGILVSTDYGQTWNAGFDAEGNAVLNSLSTITLKALEIYGATITGTVINFGDLSNKYMTASPTNTGIKFSGNGNYDIDTSGNLNIQINNGNNRLNSMYMSSTNDASNYFNLINYSKNNLDNNNIANFIRMYATSSEHVILINNYDVTDTANTITRAQVTINNTGITLSKFDTSGNLMRYLTLSNSGVSYKDNVNGIELSTINGNIYFKGSALYWNGAQKW